MTLQEIAAAMQRVRDVLQRKPEKGAHEDAPATARWEGGMRVVSSHESGVEFATDMPPALGGTGERPTPGWVFRAGLASCTATRIAMSAAAEGIALSLLEVKVKSRSDMCGLLDVPGPGGAAVSAGPGDLRVEVRLAAPGVAPERLHALVDAANRCSPILAAVQSPLAVALKVEVPGS